LYGYFESMREINATFCKMLHPSWRFDALELVGSPPTRSKPDSLTA